MEAETLEKNKRYHYVIHDDADLFGVVFNNKKISKVPRTSKYNLFQITDMQALYKMFNLHYFDIEFGFKQAYDQLIEEFPIHGDWRKIQFLEVPPLPSVNMSLPSHIKPPKQYLWEYLEASDDYFGTNLSLVARDEAIKAWKQSIVEYDYYSISKDLVTFALLLAPTLFEWRNTQLILKSTLV